jgi:hypothetical protein
MGENRMSVHEAIKKYTETFGGFPYYSLMGASDEYIIEIVTEALKTGKEPNFYTEDEIY